MGQCVACRDNEGHNSDAEHHDFFQEYGARPMEFRIWMKDNEANRRVFAQARQRLEDLVSDVSQRKVVGFTDEEMRVDQYFCAGPSTGAKAATRDGKITMEVKRLLPNGFPEGAEQWDKDVKANLSEFLRLPWVSLRKARTRCKTKKALKGTQFEGLKALELTEVRLVPDKIYGAAAAAAQPLKNDSYLTLAVEGTPESIRKVMDGAQLDGILSSTPGCLKNPDGQSGSLYRFNVSYPRFINIERA